MKGKNKSKLDDVYIKNKIFIVLIIFITFIPFSITFSRYATNAINNFVTNSKRFYFNSDKLSVNNPVYSIGGWSGVDNYIITINMNSRYNSLLDTDYDIDYNINYTCSDNAICSLSKTNGIIPSSTNSDYFNLIITPNRQLQTGDTVAIQVTAASQTGYKKVLKGKFNLVVGKQNLSYAIVDSLNSLCFELNITNTLQYYIVRQKFDSYSVGDKINIDTYSNLSSDNKNKCASSIVTLNFDPNLVVLDMTDSNYLNAKNVATTNVKSYNYVSSITFNVDAISSTRVRFYKKDITKNYTYPNSQNNSVIQLTSM